MKLTIAGREPEKDGAKKQPLEQRAAAGKDFKDTFQAFLAPRLRELKFDLHLLSKSATSIAGLILLLMLIVVAAVPWVFAEPNDPDPYQIPFDKYVPDPLPPLTDGFILGSGNNGADIYYGIIWGARLSMSFSIQVVLASVVVGTFLGLVSGFKGGVIDEMIMRLTDIFLSVPSLILVMAIAAVMGKDLGATKLALIAVWWSGYTRLVRGQVLSIRENSYIDAARASGSGEGKIMLRHIFPNSWAPVLVSATMDMGTVVLVMAGLSYIGLGAAHGMAEWGVMINDGQKYFVIGYWWMVFFPGMAILTFVMAFNLLGDGLRDIFDPKMRR
ncbi:MAG: ABC transporter permease [Thermoplasmata archaeon]|nr:ABC transporter permease [Thermoplasmata archaeon]